MSVYDPNDQQKPASPQQPYQPTPDYTPSSYTPPSYTSPSYPTQAAPVVATPNPMAGMVNSTSDVQQTASGDRWGLIAMTIVVMTVLSCVPGLNCLAPLAPLVAGIVTLTKANNAVNPQQVRTFGWIATILGALLVLLVLGIVVLYGSLIFTMMNEVQNLSAP